MQIKGINRGHGVFYTFNKTRTGFELTYCVSEKQYDTQVHYLTGVTQSSEYAICEAYAHDSDMCYDECKSIIQSVLTASSLFDIDELRQNELDEINQIQRELNS